MQEEFFNVIALVVALVVVGLIVALCVAITPMPKDDPPPRWRTPEMPCDWRGDTATCVGDTPPALFTCVRSRDAHDERVIDCAPQVRP